MTRNLEISVGEFYHVYNRGSDKRNIFTDQKDYQRFLKTIYLCNSSENAHLSNYQKLTLEEFFSVPHKDQLVAIGAYCLMPNHFHLLLKETKENGISLFMQKLSTAYTMYFNKKHERTGALFGGTFKVTHANNDNYLKYLFSYIHLNPIKLIDLKWKERSISDLKKAKKYLINYRYSSFNDYFQKNKTVFFNLLNKKEFPEYFDRKNEFESEIEDWLTYKNSTEIEK